MVVFVKRVVFLGALIGLWAALFRLNIWSSMVFPSPSDAWSSLSGGFADGTIPAAIVASMRRVVIGYVISFVIGMIIGVAMARWKTVQETVGMVVLGMQTLPSICWLPLALLWFGLSETSVILVVVLGSTFAITEAFYDGFKNTPKLYQRAALTMGANQYQLFTRVLIPAALPSIITGMKLSWSFAWRSLMAGELLYTDVGLGQLLMRGRDLADMGEVIAIMIVIVAIGLLVNFLVFTPLERRTRTRWGLFVDGQRAAARPARAWPLWAGAGLGRAR